MSFGGILAPRVASVEHRFAATLAIDGLWSVQYLLEQEFPSVWNTTFQAGNQTGFNELAEAYRTSTEVPTGGRWILDQGLWAFATNDSFDMFTKLGAINVTESLVKDIQGPVFIGSAEDDYAPGQAEIVAGWLGDQAYYHFFPNTLGSGQHCQIGAEDQLAYVAFNWLDGVFSGKKLTANGTVVGTGY